MSLRYRKAASAGMSLAMGCPKWDACSAPHCPVLDGRHLPGERVCLYLREAVKDDGTAILGRTLPTPLAGVVLRAAHGLLPRSGPLGRALQQASRHGSRVMRAHRLACTPTAVRQAMSEAQ